MAPARLNSAKIKKVLLLEDMNRSVIYIFSFLFLLSLQGYSAPNLVSIECGVYYLKGVLSYDKNNNFFISLDHQTRIETNIKLAVGDHLDDLLRLNKKEVLLTAYIPIKITSTNGEDNIAIVKSVQTIGKETAKNINFLESKDWTISDNAVVKLDDFQSDITKDYLKTKYKNEYSNYRNLMAIKDELSLCQKAKKYKKNYKETNCKAKADVYDKISADPKYSKF